MSATHPKGQPLDELLQHLYDEHEWVGSEPDEGSARQGHAYDDEYDDDERDAERFRFEHCAERVG